jgi:uncharacterized protein
MFDLAIYHGGGCLDGFCAAWLCSRVFPVECVPMNYGEEPPDVTGRNVIIVDFSFKREVLLAMKSKAKSLLVLDHHKTAKDDLDGLDFCVFDMEKSGARLTLEFIDRVHGSGLNRDSRWLVDYTEDRDLWRHKLANTKEINAGLRSHPLDFQLWNSFAADPAFLTEIAIEGTGILRYQKKLIDSHIRHAAPMQMAGHSVLAVNCTCADLTSEIAGELAKDRPFGVCWFESSGGHRVVSLRSTPEGIDVSEVAKANGGGGHKRAAGFTCNLFKDVRSVDFSGEA